MFDWMKKKPVAENKVSERLEIVELSTKLFSATVCAIVEQRLRHVRENYPKLLRDLIEADIANAEIPPKLAARNQFKTYLSMIKQIPDRLRDEIHKDCSEALAFFSDDGDLDIAESYIAKVIDQSMKPIWDDAELLVKDFAPWVQTADVHWRQQYPDKAALYPQ